MENNGSNGVESFKRTTGVKMGFVIEFIHLSVSGLSMRLHFYIASQYKYLLNFSPCATNTALGSYAASFHP